MRSSNPPRLIWLGLAVAAWSLVALVVLAAKSEAHGAPAAGWLYLLFAPVCHQLPERSFFAFGEQLGVCHRCFGLYLGGALGLTIAPFVGGLRRWLLERPQRILWFLAPIVIDFALFPWNTSISRFVTGIVAALALAFLVLRAAGDLTRGRRRAVAGEPSPESALPLSEQETS